MITQCKKLFYPLSVNRLISIGQIYVHTITDSNNLIYDFLHVVIFH